MNAIEVRGRRTDGSGRWFRLRFALRPKRLGPLVTYRAGFVCDFQATDDLAATYELAVWESGIVSGLGFVLRRTPDHDWGIELDLMDGEIGSQDLTGLANAALIAAFYLHGQKSTALPDKEWEFLLHDVRAVPAPDTGGSENDLVRPPASVT